ncbi:hypothetical protein [Ectobacillus ponti]|uniref:Uncharacterized protein n=1 Tax=Ectobacillus ponti TaxID=2961894 RepID=A0AA42BRT4_9BACI|nr:hypothetical protein [Ectobacillus ponti]MCP8969849.1 hypothetical protein [Ectobacillus ponti]
MGSKLVLVEGIAGSGKSTNARLQDVAIDLIFDGMGKIQIAGMPLCFETWARPGAVFAREAVSD